MRTSSVDEFAAVLDGSYFGDKFEALQAYAYVKYAETLWTLSMARKYPKLKFIVVSPGKYKRNSRRQIVFPRQCGLC